MRNKVRIKDLSPFTCISEFCNKHNLTLNTVERMEIGRVCRSMAQPIISYPQDIMLRAFRKQGYIY